MQVVSTAALPIDLAAQVTAAVPGVHVSVPADGHVPIADLDLSSADALVCLLLDRIDADLLARAPRLRVVANCAVGIDNIDLAAATAAGVCITNTPDVLTEATAELAFTLMMAAARRLGEGERLIRSGAWTGWALDQLIGLGLAGKTLGIIGYGRIGQAMARRALGFGMRVIYADPRADAHRPGDGDDDPSGRPRGRADAGAGEARESDDDPSGRPRDEGGGGARWRDSDDDPSGRPRGRADAGAGEARESDDDPSGRPRDAGAGGARWRDSDGADDPSGRQRGRADAGAVRCETDEVFATADVVSLHCPLVPETRLLVNARRLALMKPTAILVNTARGGCVDDGALADALTAGRLFGAALDVYTREPAIDPRLVAAPRLVLAPHIGSATTEARTAMAQLCADAVISVLRGHLPPNLVNNVAPAWSRRS